MKSMLFKCQEIFGYKFLISFLAITACTGTAFAGTSPLTDMIPPALMWAQLVGHHDPSSVLHTTVVLKLRNTAQLKNFLKQVQDPASEEYRQFLTPQQFTSLYGPTQDQVSTVVDYLEKQGLQVVSVAPDNLSINVRGTSGTYEKALGIQINDYVYQGRRVYGTRDNPQLPTAIAGQVQSVLGLTDIIRLYPMLARPSITLSPPLIASYIPQQIATAYDWPYISDSANGAGVTIANATADSSNLSVDNLDTFWSHYELPAHSVTIINVDGQGNLTDGTDETTLDEEWGGAMAPGAKLQIYDASNYYYQDFFDTYSTIVNNNQAQIMTTSWGSCEPDIGGVRAGEEDVIFMQAAAQGITVFAAAGDSGSSDSKDCLTDYPDQADYPSSDPYVVAAGGTKLTLNTDNAIASEVAWSLTGGAESQYFSEPSWQVGAGVSQNGARNTSDISMDADPATGYTIYNGSWQKCWGGTSFVAPQLAGLFAVFVSLSGEARLGLANPVIYADANSGLYANDFHDITEGNNGEFSAGIGWDHPTGWGSFDAVNLLSHMDGSIALSAPSRISMEYMRCVNRQDKYLVSWGPGQVGSASSYHLEQGSAGTWVTVYEGSGMLTSLFRVGEPNHISANQGIQRYRVERIQASWLYISALCSGVLAPWTRYSSKYL